MSICAFTIYIILQIAWGTLFSEKVIFDSITFPITFSFSYFWNLGSFCEQRITCYVYERTYSSRKWDSKYNYFTRFRKTLSFLLHSYDLSKHSSISSWKSSPRLDSSSPDKIDSRCLKPELSSVSVIISTNKITSTGQCWGYCLAKLASLLSTMEYVIWAGERKNKNKCKGFSRKQVFPTFFV